MIKSALIAIAIVLAVLVVLFLLYVIAGAALVAAAAFLVFACGRSLYMFVDQICFRPR